LYNDIYLIRRQEVNGDSTVYGSHDEADLSCVCGAGEMGIYLES